MRLGICDQILLQMVRLIDFLQDGVLKNYPLFTFIVSHAPQKLGATLCHYRAFREFLVAYQRVPGYRSFLEKSGWNPPKGGSIREIFASLPITDKPGYILPYSMEERSLDGSFFHHGVVIDESSGATGIPHNWVRSAQEREIVKQLIAVYLRYCFEGEKFVVINAFSMGAWATGFNMALAAQSLGVVKSTGPDVDKILHTLQHFGPRYPYILNGYPPFLKHLFDEGERRGFQWRQYKVHALVGGEGMSEGLRDHLLRYAQSAYSGYGASDLEIGIGGENPLTVKIRKLCQHDPSLKKELFGDDQRLPMLFQYNPLDHLVEIVGQEVVVTVSKPWTISPKIRYNIKDEGGMITFDEMRGKLEAHGIDMAQLEQESRYPRWYLPFLYIYGRKDNTISVMGANIYPEDVENVIYSDPTLAKHIGSFMLSLQDDATGNPHPCFAFELESATARAQIEERIAALLVDGLSSLNADFRKGREEYPEALEPIIHIFDPGQGPFRENADRIKKRYIAAK